MRRASIQDVEGNGCHARLMSVPVSAILNMAQPAEERSVPFGRFQIYAVGGQRLERRSTSPSFSSRPPRAMLAGSTISKFKSQPVLAPDTRQTRAAIVAPRIAPDRGDPGRSHGAVPARPGPLSASHPDDVLVLAGTAAAGPAILPGRGQGDLQPAAGHVRCGRVCE